MNKLRTRIDINSTYYSINNLVENSLRGLVSYEIQNLILHNSIRNTINDLVCTPIINSTRRKLYER